MTPDQLNRHQRTEIALADVRRLLVRVPPEVLNGGAVRSAAWKAAALKAHKLLRQAAPRPEALEEAARDLRVATSADPSNLQYLLNAKAPASAGGG